MKETIQEKYQSVRDQVDDGCLFLISKDAFFSKTIRRHDRNADNTWADHSHVGIVYSKFFNGRKCLFALDANANGSNPGLLSDRINLCDKFIFIKPLCDSYITAEALYETVRRAQGGAIWRRRV